MAKHLIGCSGWSYPWWRGNFYPPSLRSKDQLSFYSRSFRTVEVNMTFYRFPTARSVEAWRAATDEDFTFAVKMNRSITHYRKLKQVGGLLDSFLGSVAALGDKLGPVLIQLPPDLGPDHQLLEGFLDHLPRALTFAIEFRDRGWMTGRTYRLLERFGVALVMTDPPPPGQATVTAGHAYVRWHGRSGPGYEYSGRELAEWAGLLEGLPVERVYGYFNNDQGGAAPRNARALQGLLGTEIGVGEVRPLVG